MNSIPKSNWIAAPAKIDNSGKFQNSLALAENNNFHNLMLKLKEGDPITAELLSAYKSLNAPKRLWLYKIQA